MEKESVRCWLKKSSNQLILLVVLIAFVTNIYFFSITSTQPLWWDEAEYMLKSKSIAFGTSDAAWWTGRPILFPVVLSGFLMVGFGEGGIRFMMVLVSMASLILLLAIGKRLFNERTTIIATFLFSFFYLTLFYTTRILTDVPSIFLTLLIFWLFLNRNKSKYFIWAIFPTAIVSFLIRFPNILVFISILMYLLIAERKAFIDKNYWISLFLGLLILAPYMVWSQSSFGHPLYAILEAGSGSIETPAGGRISVLLTYMQSMPSYLGAFLLIIFLGSAIHYFFNFFLGIGWNFNTPQQRKGLLILLWILIPLLYFGFFVNHFEDRYIFGIFPAIFLLIGNGFDLLWRLIKKYNKGFSGILIILLILFGGWQLISYSDNVISSKVESYKGFQEVGEWIKQNSLPEDSVLATGRPQINYYSERATYGHGQNLSEELEKIEDHNAKYIVISSWERSPSWIYTYLSGNQTEFILRYQTSSDHQGQKMFVAVFSRGLQES